LAESDCREVEQHVETCRQCAEELERLTASEGEDLPIAPIPRGGSDNGQTPRQARPPAAPAPPLPRIPGYEVVGRLGQGGMGVVYLALDLLLRRRVALKAVLAGGGATPRQLERFRIEAEAMSRLHHPHIITIYEVSEHDGQPFFAMEYLAGGDLEKKLAGRLPSPREAALLAETLARAMHHAHQHGVVHRDLKPANILLAAPPGPSGAADRAGASSFWDPGCVKITDFGLARVLDEGGARTRLTLTEELLGTPAYMAPEQAAGRVKEIGTLSDVYALGAILYKALTGHPPYEAANNQGIIAQILSEHGGIPPPRRLRPDVPADLELICLKCLEREPARRYASAEQLAGELRCFLENKPLIHTRPVGRAERAWRWCGSNPALAAASALAALLLVAVAVVSALFAVNKAHDAEALTAALGEKDKSYRDLVRADEGRRAALRKSAALALERGWKLCQEGDVRQGMFWLAHSLEVAPADADLQYAIRANLASWQRRLAPSLQQVFRHPGRVLAVALSPDGKLALTGGDDNTARLWDVTTGGPVGNPMPHQDPVAAVAFSPDGKYFVTGGGKPGNPNSNKPEVRLWEVATSRPLDLPPIVHAGSVLAVAFSPDGKWVLTGSADATAQLWELVQGERGPSWRHRHTWRHDKRRVFAVALSPDGRTALTGSSRWSEEEKRFVGVAQLWDVSTGAALGEPFCHPAFVTAVAFSPDGKLVLTGCADSTARLWDKDTRKSLDPPLGHRGAVLAVAFSPDGKTVLTAGDDCTARLWETATGRPIGPPLLHPGAVTSAAFGPGGKTFLTGDKDKGAWLWEAPRATPPLGHQGWLNAVAFSPDGKLFLTGAGELKAQPGGKEKRVEGGGIRLWRTATAGPLGEPAAADQGAVMAVSFSRDGRTVLTASTDGTARLWDVVQDRQGPSLRQRHVFRHPRSVYAAAMSPDGRTVLTGGADGTARLWDVATGKPIGKAMGHDGRVTAVAFSPDGRTALTGSADQTVRFWDAATGAPAAPGPLPHPDRVYAVAFSPDGRHVLTGSGDAKARRGEARLWEAATGRPVGLPLPHEGAVLAVAFSPDGKQVLTGSTDNTAQLWDAAAGVPLGPPFRDRAWVKAVAFHPDGRTVLTGGYGRAARLWKAPAPLEGDVERIRAWVQTLTGMELDAGGPLRIRLLDPEAWQQRRRRLSQLGGPPAPRAEPPGAGD
jgi:WD40 repeat protein/serine/threonine protein kinase